MSWWNSRKPSPKGRRIWKCPNNRTLILLSRAQSLRHAFYLSASAVLGAGGELFRWARLGAFPALVKDNWLHESLMSLCPAQHSTGLDPIHIPTSNSPEVRACLFLLARFQILSTFSDMSICYLNVSSIMGNVAESSLKTLHRLLPVASRLAAATNEFL